MEIFFKLFDPTGFVPRAQCGDWTRGLIWLHNVSDFFIWTAYLAIPVVLLAFAHKRRHELPFRQLFWLFGLFILACGTTHLLDIVLFYYPVYRLAGVVKFITAAASWGTVMALIPIVPRALAMRTPEVLEREIAERIRVEEQLRRSEERFRSSFQYAAIGKALVSLNGGWIEVNPALCKLVGYSESELLALTFQDITHPDDLDDDLNYLQQLVDGNIDKYQLEKRYLHKEGHEVWILLSVSLVRDNQQQPLYFISQIQDITARKQAETMRQQMNADLERRVLERTAELADAKEEAETANRAKSQLLSRTSHELRTPLNAILGFGQLLEMDDLDAEQTHSVEMILKAGRHQLRLVDRILDVAGIESGQLAVTLEPVAVDEVLQEALQQARPLAAENDVQLRLDDSAQAKNCVLADRARLLQVLANLLSNAIQFNRAGGEVSLACHVTTGGDRLRIAISDTGRGIAPDQLQRLFTLFERLGADEAGIEGTGIGLALSKGLAEAMRGTLSVQSTLGVGSTFAIELPLLKIEDIASDTATSSLLPTHKVVAEAVVLYIEDNESNLELIQYIVGQRPATKTLSAMQGRRGLEMARAQKPDLILLDLHLPDINGDEVLRLLREDADTREIPVIMVSADATPGQIERLRALGARDYLTKPLDIKQLLKVIEENLTGF